MSRAHNLRRFLGDRSWRLLIPLLFGIAVIVPPQAWVELVSQHGYQGGFAGFWARDWFSFSRIAGVIVPNWNHLWFVAYLWFYTALLAVSVAVVRPLRWQHGFDRCLSGGAVLFVPLAWFAAIHAWWFLFAPETHGLVDDPMAHVEYLPAFLFGFGLARSERIMAAAVRWHRVAAAVALAGYAWIAAAQLDQVPHVGHWLRLYGLAHAMEQWGGVIALIGVAERHWNRDAPFRPVLTEAVFPFYLIHQTVIVVGAWWLAGRGLSMVAESAALIALTAAGCAAFYFAGRAVPLLRPLIGLRLHRARNPAKPLAIA